MGFYKPNGILKIKDYQIQVCVKEDQDSENIRGVGVDNIQVYYVGNVVNNGLVNQNSKILPIDIKLKDTAILEIDNGSIKGEFVFTQIIRSRFKGVERSLGQSFKGYLYPKSNYQPSDWN